MSTHSQLVEQLFTTPKEYIILNADDPDPITFGAFGETKTIPPCDEVLEPHPKYADVAHSAKDADGDYIPGSLALTDLYAVDQVSGLETVIWSAANAIKEKLGIDTKTGICSGEYYSRGVSVLPPNPSKEVVAQVRADGTARNRVWRVKQAKMVVDAHDAMNGARAKANMPTLPGDAAYMRAHTILEASIEEERKQFTGTKRVRPVRA